MAENRQTSSRVVFVFCGYRRGAVAYFTPKGTPTTCDSEMGFGATLFFLLPVVGVRTIQSYLNFMDNITKQNGNEVGKRQVEGQTIIINQQERRSTNGLGTAGFILALLGLIFNWVPGLGWVLWALGLIFSFVGIFRTPRGLAIAGLVISCIALIVLIILVSAIASLV